MQITMASARVNAGLTQNEVSELMGITPKTLITWERGQREPKFSQLQKFCEICGCEVSDIRFEEAN